MNRPRSTIANLMVVVLLVALLLAIRTSEYLVFLAVMVLNPWVLGPFLLHRTHWQSARLEFVPVDPFSAEVPDEIRRAMHDLKFLGFAHRRTYRLAKHVPDVTGYITIHANPMTSDVAKAVVGVSASLRVAYLVFASELTDGVEIVTSNNSFPMLTPPLGEPIRGMASPGIRDATRL